MKKIAIIGAGIGGIATSIRLAKRGFKVTVFEKNLYPGGKIAQIQKNGYRFDTGPSLFTLPELVEELFKLCGENPSDYLNYQKIDPVCQYFYPDGTNIKAFAQPEKFASELEEKTGEPQKNTFKFLNKYKELYNIAAPVFLFNSFHKLKNFAKPEFKKTLFKLHKLDSVKTMNKRNSGWFKTAHAQQLFNRYATYNGSDPYQTPATLNMIAHLEHNLGAYFPEKGMYNIVDALYQLAIKQGVEFRLGTKVEKVESSKGHITGLWANGEHYPILQMVSNSDAAAFYRRLFNQAKIPGSVKKHELSSSGLIFYWGINRQFPELDLHNILFSENYKAEFEAIFKKKTIFNDPTVYIFISSKKVSSDAPKGKENWFVMINTPANYGQNWEELIPKAKKAIINKINKQMNINIEEYIEFEHHASPITIEQNTASWKGALYGNSSNGLLSAFNRHPNFSRKYKNLYFTGGSVHPGGGIPLCLCSAKIVDDLIPDEPKF